MSRTVRSQDCFDEFEQERKGFQRDRKPSWKPPKEFKQLKRRQERAKAKQALREGRELPRVRHTDTYDWS